MPGESICVKSGVCLGRAKPALTRKILITWSQASS